MVTKESFPRRPHPEAGIPQENPARLWPVAFGVGQAMVRRGNSSGYPTAAVCRAEAEQGGVTLTPQELVAPLASKGFPLRILEKLELWWQRYRSRRELAGLDDRMLKDMGVSSADALRESSKPFWLK